MDPAISDEENCRMERDSSNDQGTYQESSGEEQCDDEPSKDELVEDSGSSTSQCLDENSLVMGEDEREYYEKSKDGHESQLSHLKCTTCSCQLFLVNPEGICFHPVLGVLICKSCREFYGNGPFTKDENGYDEYCRWCAEGGKMLLCDTCTNVFCKACLRRCVGRAALSEIQSPGSCWSCLVCDNQPIWPQRALSRTVLSMLQSNSKCDESSRDPSAADDGVDPSVWLPAIISETEKLGTYCKTLAGKIGKNWSKTPTASPSEENRSGLGSNDQNKVIHCCRKLRKAIVTTRFNLKLLEKKMVTRYGQSGGSADDISVDSKSELMNRLRDSTSSPSGKLSKVKNPDKTSKGDKRKNSLHGNSPLPSTDSSPSIPARKTSAVSNGSAKESDDGSLSLFGSARARRENQSLNKEAGGNDGQVEEGLIRFASDKVLNNSCEESLWDPADGDNFEDLLLCPDEPPRATSEQRGPDDEIESDSLSSNPSRILPDVPMKKVTKGKDSQSPEHKATDPTSNSDKLESQDSVATEPLVVRSAQVAAKPTFDPNEKARRDLLKDSSDESSDSDVDLKLKRIEKKATEKSRTEGLDDPKLKAECAVIIDRITDLQKMQLTGRDEDKTDDEEPDLDKRLSRLAEIRVTTSTKRDKLLSSSDSEDADADNAKKTKQTPKPKTAKKKFRLTDLGSSSESDENRETQSPIEADGSLSAKPVALAPFLDRNEATRLELLASSTSEDESEADTVEETAGNDALDETEENRDDRQPDEEAAVKDVKKEIDDDDDDEGIFARKESKGKSLPRLSLPDESPDVKSSDVKVKEEPGAERKVREKKKQRIDSDSDFQHSDSEAEKKKTTKKRKQKKSSGSDSNEEEAESESKPKRRRRIKKASSSDDSDDSDVQILNESQNKSGSKGRKNIKKIMKDRNLQDETKAAAKEEEARKKRIADRQKYYNDAFAGDKALENAKIDHLVLDFDPKTKAELVTVDSALVTKLKPHQAKGVKFMWDACFESIERIKEHPGSGCILAHCMGLGKTLQVVTLVHTVLSHELCKVNRVLVVCPLSTVLNWVNEFKMWLVDDLEVDVYELASVKTNDIRVYTLRHWFENGGVMILGYDMYRNLSNETNKKIKPKWREVFQRALVNPGPDLVVCDEGHLLKNESTALSKAMNRIATRRRIVLTGTPLQNNLDEYHCMIQFVKPNLLGTKKEFTNRFANPIKNGQAADSTDADVRVMKRRAHVLHKMLEDSVQRFDYSVLTPFLPPKHEYVISVKMSDLQIQLYQHYLEFHAKGGPSSMSMGRGKGAGLFADFQELGRVWTHPKALLLAQINRDLKAIGQSDSDSINDFIVDDRSTPASDDGGIVCLDDSGDERGSEQGDAVRTNGWKSRTRAGRGDQPPPEDELGVTAPLTGSWWSKFVTDDDMTKIEHSGKFILLMDILRQCELIGDKVLVFSQSLVSLNLIEEFLAAEEAKNDEIRSNMAKGLGDPKMESIGTWRKNADYFRLDGQTSPELRKNWCNSFNHPDNLRSRLFLISTKAGGLGINLVAANRVIIFDASWNPSHDVQSIFRIYRFGQKKPCYVYRFLAQGTMEEKIYDRQVTKLSLSCRVVDEQQIERHFNSADLSELYIFESDSHLRRPTPLLPKDRLLAELTIQRKDWIVTYHEHDSLLENKAEEELNEEERKAAWDDFENEKRGVPNMSMYADAQPGFGAMPGMVDILSSLAGRSVAGVPLNSIATMIYNSNPGITQEEFLGRLRLTVEQLQNFSVQQAAVQAAAAATSASVLQQPSDSQRLLAQRQMAADQMKRQFGSIQPSVSSIAGPSGITTPLQPRSRGRPTIGPHQRTDLYGLGPVISSSLASNMPQSSPGGLPAPGPNR